MLQREKNKIPTMVFSAGLNKYTCFYFLVLIKSIKNRHNKNLHNQNSVVQYSLFLLWSMNNR